MNRRSFLRGLLSLPVAAELGRVYSFPTDIVIAKPTYMFGKNVIYSMRLDESIQNLPQSAVKYYRGWKYQDYLCYSDLALITTLDPVVAAVGAEMAERNGRWVSTLVQRLDRSGFERVYARHPRQKEECEQINV